MHGTIEASKLRKGKSGYNPWTHISNKELIYLLQKFISPRSKVLLHMPLGGQIGRKRPPLVLGHHSYGRHAIINHAPTSQHNQRLYVHAQGITKLNTNILTKHNRLLVPPTYYHLYIAKLLQGIKHIIFSDLQVLCRIL